MNAPTVDVIYGCGAAGQLQDPTVADVDVLDDVSTQLGVFVKCKEHADEQQRDEPGQRAGGVQASRSHDVGVPERLTHSDVPAENDNVCERCNCHITISWLEPRINHPYIHVRMFTSNHCYFIMLKSLPLSEGSQVFS